MINPAIFKAYDIRGIYGKDIDENNIQDIVKAIYTYMVKYIGKSPLSIGLSHDMRISSPTLYKHAKEALIELGAHVKEIGLASTPTMYFAVLKHNLDIGIQISASHNPKEYNGLKIVRRDGEKVYKIGKTTGMADVKDIAISKQFLPATSGGTVETLNNVLDEEIKSAVDAIKPSHIKKLRIVADPANAIASLYLDKLALLYPIELVRMNWELDGTFPNHQASPLEPKNTIDLQKRVLEEKADLGIAPDGDADRVMFVNEKGIVISPTMITALVANEILKDNLGSEILVDIRYLRNSQYITQKLGGKIGISAVGHALITEQLNREGGIFAGESSGHYFFKATGGAESAVRVVLYVLEVMSRESKTISEILKAYQSSYESGEFNFVLKEGTNAQEVFQMIEKKYNDGELSTLDGIAISYTDWRFGVRSSNTEPLLRLNVESATEQMTKEKLKELSELILATGAHAHE
ncbi:MAG: phosphomannomutase/phosphoglucomutase [Candidatus Roizmanbacteria bacterium]